MKHPSLALRLLGLVPRALRRLLRVETASGVLLLLCAAAALAWANSPWSAAYKALWHSPLGGRTLAWVVNDVLMAVFFFVVGMEIRGEVHNGELSAWRRAALPISAALGGMLVPALVYLAVVGSSAARSGWGVPMATDIAFALGVLALLGRRVPAALRVLLLALAVIDDLGAILIIAFFYSQGLAVWGFVVAAAGLAGIVVMQRLGVGRKVAYFPPAVVVWAGIYGAGVHPTIAGVLVGLLTPVRPWPVRGEDPALARSPGETLIKVLHPYVSFGIMPVFALANAGVVVSALSWDMTSARCAIGLVLGLVVGKPLGILLACVLALRLRVAALPRGLGARHLLLLGLVAGIGFTMALFIAQLAFVDERLLGAAKLAVLGASALAGILSLGVGLWLLPDRDAAAPLGIADPER